ncbi:hypothetical protein yinte0001_27640 [Yersinia intermedia ATCC 29909]|nr:hypothetical protein yinte0001_27640 [Yersinia intermedia ATCC 29909]
MNTIGYQRLEHYSKKTSAPAGCHLPSWHNDNYADTEGIISDAGGVYSYSTFMIPRSWLA